MDEDDIIDSDEIVSDNKENMIIVPKELKLPGHILMDYEEYFYCPKCGSSLITMAEEYTKNNIANQIYENSDQEGMCKDEEMNWRKLILKCDICRNIDLIIKFLKIRETRYRSTLNSNSFNLIQPKQPYSYTPVTQTKSYYTGNMANKIR